MAIPFRYKFDSSSNQIKILSVTEENFVDMLHAICSARPNVAYWNLIEFAWKCTSYYDDEQMFGEFYGGLPVELSQLFRSFITLNYPGSHWASDRDFLYEVLKFLVDKMEVIEYTVQTHLNLTFSTHRKKVYEQVARINRRAISK